MWLTAAIGAAFALECMAFPSSGIGYGKAGRDAGPPARYLTAWIFSQSDFS